MKRADYHAARYKAATPQGRALWWLALICAPYYIAAEMLRPEAPSPTGSSVTKRPTHANLYARKGEKGAR